MRSCCCCNVRTGTYILGALNLIACVLVLIPLCAYLVKSDISAINPIEENKKNIENVVEDLLREHNWTTNNYNQVMDSLKEWWPTVALILASLAAISATAAVMLILGVRCRIRCLMIPFLVLTMLDIISSGAGGIIIVVALFYSNIITGIVSAVVYVLIAVLSLFFWAVVLAAYKVLGSEEYEYSPAPTKAPEYYPSAPQHFDMADHTREFSPNNHRNHYPYEQRNQYH
eukprot:TRINITY_DN2557_c0_g1_i1.p1 TRINITY_DN2557_c0_g1~~TRINITY_DN2557_c0_g1_i1.p1  ORF type:complete len:229 (+),score=24.52 TRINITY_DN2557_c0_g1_i1:166-852(+)